SRKCWIHKKTMKKILLPFLLIATISLIAFQNWKTDPVTNFLESLNPEQREKAMLPFDDATRETWHFIPAAMWARDGIPLFELDDSQKELLFVLLQEYLSATGYSKTRKIMDL